MAMPGQPRSCVTNKENICGSPPCECWKKSYLPISITGFAKNATLLDFGGNLKIMFITFFSGPIKIAGEFRCFGFLPWDSAIS